eukprot:g73232.t1
MFIHCRRPYQAGNFSSSDPPRVGGPKMSTPPRSAPSDRVAIGTGNEAAEKAAIQYQLAAARLGEITI